MPLPPPNTVQPQKQTFGGFQTATLFSGQVLPSLTSCPGAVAVGSDVLLCSGAGRLDSITVISNLTSGTTAISFYDAAAPVSGGPIPSSGHKFLTVVPSQTNLVSGQILLSGYTSVLTGPFSAASIPVGMPFQSGLCVNSRSGQPAFTVAWTPERAGQ